MNDEPHNPYAAPQAELQPRPALRQRLVNGAAWSWLFVFLINLPLPVALGWEACTPAGCQAMLLTLALMFGISTWLVSTNEWYRVRMIIGGVCVAVSQFFPVLQFITGMIGLSLVEALGLMPRRPPDDDAVFILLPQLNQPSAIFLTLFVGLVLMLVALILGTLFRPKDSSVLQFQEPDEAPS